MNQPWFDGASLTSRSSHRLGLYSGPGLRLVAARRATLPTMPRSIWLSIVLMGAITSGLLFLESYEGYGTVVGAVALSAAVNLFP